MFEFDYLEATDSGSGEALKLMLRRASFLSTRIRNHLDESPQLYSEFASAQPDTPQNIAKIVQNKVRVVRLSFVASTLLNLLERIDARHSDGCDFKRRVLVDPQKNQLGQTRFASFQVNPDF